MATEPRVSIVMPLYNDEDFVADALDSCLAQTLREIEVICVDDASTDGTVAVVQEYQKRDSRVRLLRQPENSSAFQARRVGITAASARFVLFLDGDDQLDARAAATALARASSAGADVVGFGVEIVAPGGVPSKLAAALQPAHAELRAADIIPSLFPAGEAANGHLWRYLFDTRLLRAAYSDIGDDMKFYRANDLPVSFLALAHARKYASVPDRLYRYHFRRGTSGHRVDGVDRFAFLLSGVAPIAAIRAQVHSLAERSGAAATGIVASYESARLHIIANVLGYTIRDTAGSLQRACIEMLTREVGALDVIRAAAAFCAEALPALSASSEAATSPREPRSILLATRRLDTGGLQSVLVDQAERLLAAGHVVGIVVMERVERELDLPSGIDVIELTNESQLARVDHWVEICRDRSVDVIIDHHILYNEHWPWRALAAKAVGVPTIGWLHNFALRPLFDGSRRISFLTAHLATLFRVVTLSAADVVFWKMRGIHRVAYLPNPPSSLTVAALQTSAERSIADGRLELAWWGRLNTTTKQTQHLVAVAAELRARGIDFRLTIIGPDSRELSSTGLRQQAQARGVDDAIELLGELSTDELLSTLTDAHLLVSTSAIEGYQLTIPEAEAMGMPVVMYDLPWLDTVRDNPGVVTTPQGDPAALADAIVDLMRDPQRYERLSRAGRDWARQGASEDLGRLLEQLLADDLPSIYQPEPTMEDASLLLDWLVRIGERNVGTAAAGSAAADLDSVRRERDLARAKLRQITEGPSFRIGRAITKVPRRIREFVRPAARRGSPLRAVAAARAAVATPPAPLRAPSDAPTPARAAEPDISFVIPVYNAEAWLEDCVTSVLAQTGVDVEVICINDGSTDGSGDILRRLARGDARLRVIDQPNSGQSVGRNKGLDAADGRYLIYLDSDDYWPSDVAERLVRTADEQSLDMLLFDCIAFRDGDIDEKVWKWYSTYYQRAYTYRDARPGVQLMAAMRRSKDYRPHVGLYMARTDFVREQGVRFIPGIVHQDNPYTFRLLLHAARAAHERIDAYARRMRPGSTITTLNAERSARGYYLSYVEMTRALSEVELPSEAAEHVNNIVDYVFDGARKQFATLSPEALAELKALDAADDAQRIYASLIESSRSA